jgi:hypothetical protein
VSKTRLPERSTALKGGVHLRSPFQLFRSRMAGQKFAGGRPAIRDFIRQPQDRLSRGSKILRRCLRTKPRCGGPFGLAEAQRTTRLAPR